MTPALDPGQAPRAYAECWRRICRGVPGAVIWESPTVFVGVTGLPSPMMNGVIVTGALAGDRAVSDAVGVATTVAARNVVIDRSGRSASVDAWLDERGYQLVQTAPILVLSGAQGEAGQPPVPIRRATTTGTAEDHATLVSRVFSLGVEDVMASLSPANLNRSDISVRIGYLDDEPVSTAMAVVANGIGCVYNVATLAEFRGIGLGRALTESVIADARAAGARHIMLQSSEAGLRLYERMGFRTIDEWSNWVSPP